MKGRLVPLSGLPPAVLGVVCWLLLGTIPLSGQDTLVVLDGEDRLPLPGVYMTGDSTGITADNEGRLLIPTGWETDTITVSYLGYNTVRLPLPWMNGRDTLLLIPSAFTFPDCIVLGISYLRDIIPRQVEIISNEDILQAQPLTTADALANLGGVYVQKSQLGGGSPVLRGFEANRILLVVDGVRMNNAIFRAGHLQNGLSVDAGSLERVTLLYGPTALEFGSDALGGVISYQTKSAELAEKGKASGWRADASYTFSTAARAQQLAAGVGWSGQRVATHTHFAVADIGDLRTGNRRRTGLPTDFGLRPEYVSRIDGRDSTVSNPDPLRQVGSGYRQFNLLQKVTVKTGTQSDLRLNLQYSTTSDVPRYDALTERRDGMLRWARWDYGPQVRALAALSFDHRSTTPLFDRANHLVSYQYVEEDRLTRRFGDPLTENSLVNVGTLGYQSRFQKELGDHEIGYGVDARLDRVEATAFLQSFDGVRVPAAIEPRYPGGDNSLFALGAYLRGRYRINWKLSLTGGIRYSRQRMRVRFTEGGPIDWPAPYYAGIDNTTTALTTALGMDYVFGAHRLKLLFSQGFRAPNVDDFAKFRESNGQIQLPNPTLRPERVNNLEFGHEMRRGQLRTRLTAYHGWLTDAIIRTAGTGPDGQAFLDNRGEQLGVQMNSNAERARIYGVSVGADYQWQRLALATQFNWQRGVRDQLAPDGATLELPQDHLPPAYGRTTLTYEREKWELRLQLNYQWAKPYEQYAVGDIQIGRESGYVFDRTGTSDNLELTPFDPTTGRFTGSPGWWTADLYANYELTDRWTIRLKGENLLDRFYRPFAAGISAAGRDVGIGVSWRAF